MKTKRLLSSNVLGTGVLCLLALLLSFSGCRVDADMSNLDTKTELDFGVAMPVGTLSVTLGDLLGAS
ncbi:MAG: hypothetical protein SPE88_06070, partial [Paludibacteraceae bacterium]|nr:hypothetical protein [Paludibacteraceae bacterium]